MVSYVTGEQGGLPEDGQVGAKTPAAQVVEKTPSTQVPTLVSIIYSTYGGGEGFTRWTDFIYTRWERRRDWNFE